MIVVVNSLFMNEMDIIVQIMSKMDIIVQWATILSPIIAVLLAWWTVRSSAKDTNRKINSINELTRLQIDVSILEMENELSIARYRYICALENARDNTKKRRSVINENPPLSCEDELLSNSKSYEEFYSNQISSLEASVKRLNNIKKNLNSGY